MPHSHHIVDFFLKEPGNRPPHQAKGAWNLHYETIEEPLLQVHIQTVILSCILAASGWNSDLSHNLSTVAQYHHFQRLLERGLRTAGTLHKLPCQTSSDRQDHCLLTRLQVHAGEEGVTAPVDVYSLQVQANNQYRQYHITRVEEGEDQFDYFINLATPKGMNTDPEAHVDSGFTKAEFHAAQLAKASEFWTTLRSLDFKFQDATDTWRSILLDSWPAKINDGYADWIESQSSATYTHDDCPLCRNGIRDTPSHVLFECSFVHQLWDACRTALCLRPSSWIELYSSFEQVKGVKAQRTWHRQVAGIYHAVRRMYITYRFHEKEPPPERILEEQAIFAQDWSTGRGRHFAPKHRPTQPPAGPIASTN